MCARMRLRGVFGNVGPRLTGNLCVLPLRDGVARYPLGLNAWIIESKQGLAWRSMNAGSG